MEGYLPAWLITVISLVGSTLITTVVGLIIKHYFQKFMNKKEEQQIQREKEHAEYLDMKERQHREERKEDVVNMLRIEMKPLVDELNAVNSKLDKVSDGALSGLRNDILECYYKCCDKGYRNDYDYENMHHMYDSYKELNGNSFVADVIRRFDELPTKEEIKVGTKKKSTTKKVLNENK